MNTDLQVVDVTSLGENALSLAKRAELDIQISTAKAYPREYQRCIKAAIEMATCTPDIAASCLYALPKGGTTDDPKVSHKNKVAKLLGQKLESHHIGGSIREAEIIHCCWGNIHSGLRIIGNNGKTVTGEAIIWDLQTNNKITTQVEKSIMGKEGKQFSHHMQVVMGAVAAATAWRNGIFKIVPRIVTDSVEAAVKKAILADSRPIEERRKLNIDYFAEIGINEADLLEFLNKKSVAQIDNADLLILSSIRNAVNDGLLNADTILQIEKGESISKAKVLNDKLAEVMK